MNIQIRQFIRQQASLIDSIIRLASSHRIILAEFLMKNSAEPRVELVVNNHIKRGGKINQRDWYNQQKLGEQLLIKKGLEHADHRIANVANKIQAKHDHSHTSELGLVWQWSLSVGSTFFMRRRVLSCRFGLVACLGRIRQQTLLTVIKSFHLDAQHQINSQQN